MIVSENWGELLQPALRAIFDKHSKKKKDYIGKLYNIENSKKAQEFNLGTGELGLMEDWQASQGKVAYEDFQKGFKSTYIHRKYSKGVQVERELLEDDQYAEIKKRVRKLSRTVYYTTQVHAASTFNNMFNSTFAGPDGKALCATDHPKMPGSSSVISNAGALELNATNLEIVRTAMKGWTDDKGNLIEVMSDLLIVPPALRKTARIIAETDNEPFTTDHGINVWKGNINVMEYDFWLDPTAWAVVDSDRMKDFLNWFWRRKPGFKDKIEFDTEVAKYAVIGRWCFGWDDFSWIYGCKP